jgi:hypothetical protein
MMSVFVNSGSRRIWKLPQRSAGLEHAQHDQTDHQDSQVSSTGAKGPRSSRKWRMQLIQASLADQETVSCITAHARSFFWLPVSHRTELIHLGEKWYSIPV